jgi:hypothetical protein
VNPLESATIWKFFGAKTLILPTVVFFESLISHKDYLLLTLTFSNDRVSRNLPHFRLCKLYAKGRGWCDGVSFALAAIETDQKNLLPLDEGGLRWG